MNETNINTETIATWNKVAKQYEEKFMTSNDFDESYEAFCMLFKQKNPYLLEVGCGPGNITKYLLSKKKRNFTILGTDVAPNMVKLAKQNNPNTTFEVLDARKIGSLTQTFDGIVCGFCIPYLNLEDTKTFLNDCNRLLASNGILYLSFIEGNYALSGYETGRTGDQLYVHYYKKSDMMDLLHASGFSLAELQQIAHTKTNGKEQTLNVMIVRKAL